MEKLLHIFFNNLYSERKQRDVVVAIVGGRTLKIILIIFKDGRDLNLLKINENGPWGGRTMYFGRLRRQLMKSLRKKESGRFRYYMVGLASYEGGRAPPLRWRGKGKGWLLM